MAAEGRGPGRPRTGRGRDGARIEVRLTAAERAAVDAAAAAAGLTSPEYVRRFGISDVEQVAEASRSPVLTELAIEGAPPTREPVSVGGWHELADGSWGEFRWDGRLVFLRRRLSRLRLPIEVEIEELSEEQEQAEAGCGGGLLPRDRQRLAALRALTAHLR